MRALIKLLFLCMFGCTLFAQEFKLLDRDVQVHGFMSQGFAYTNQNNWLTMKTTDGSMGFTDLALNVSTQVTDKFRIGAQVYNHNLGKLGEWHPTLDWAVADYRFAPWFGVRGGKVKTVLGLYNDTQDLDFLHSFALLPQGVYPIDQRDITLAHEGGDVYGDIRLGKKLGKLSYTVYVGERRDSLYSSYVYLQRSIGVIDKSIGGLQHGADLRWATPIKGLLVGASRLDQDITTVGRSMLSPGGPVDFKFYTKSRFTNQFYGQYSRGKLTLDSEFKRYWTWGFSGPAVSQTNVHAWYVAGSYQVIKRLTLGSYYSHFWAESPIAGPTQPATTAHSYDKVVSGRFDVNRFFNFNIEGHFIDGVGLPRQYPAGFYIPDNPQGLKPTTNALVVKTSFHF